MKKIILIAISVLALQACKQKTEVAQTVSERDSLVNLLRERETSINEFMAAFNEVESNLNAVTDKQKIIMLHSENPLELKQDQKNRMNREIEAINNLMESNRKKIAELNRWMKSAANKNIQMTKTVKLLNEQLSVKDVEFASLNEKLKALNSEVAKLQTSVDLLTIQNEIKSQAISDNLLALHTAYYIVGKSKDLQDAKLIDRQGGLLGMGKTSKLSPEIDNNKFTCIDYTSINNIPVNGEDVKIITTHSPESYTLEKDEKNVVKNLVIIDPEKFWSASKYLVVVKN